MSQHKVGDHADLHLEKPEPMKIDEGFPWYTAIMMTLCIITMIGYLVAFVIQTIKYGF